MNFKEEKDLNKLETKLASFIRSARTDVRPDKEGLALILEKLDVTKLEGERSYKEGAVLSYSFFKNRTVLLRSLFGASFATALLVAFLVSVINVDFSKGDLGYQITSLEADAQVMEEDFDSNFDEEMMQEELDMEFATLEAEVSL